MYTFIKYQAIVLALLQTSAFALQPKFYADFGTGVSFGPSTVLADSTGFSGSGGTITGGSSDAIGFKTQGAAAAFADLGFNYNSYFAIEANYTFWGWQDLTTFTGQITTPTGGMRGDLFTQSVGANLVGFYPLDNKKVNIYAKLGAAAVFVDLTIDDPQNSVFYNPGKYTQSSTDFGLTYGAGVQCNYNSNIQFELGWSAISQIESHPFTNIAYNMAIIGIKYTFSKEYIK